MWGTAERGILGWVFVAGDNGERDSRPGRILEVDAVDTICCMSQCYHERLKDGSGSRFETLPARAVVCFV